jgi:hypothetical protein
MRLRRQPSTACHVACGIRLLALVSALLSRLSLAENACNFQGLVSLRPFWLPFDQRPMEPRYNPREESYADARESDGLAVLYEALESRPRDVEIHQLLIEAWLSLGELGKRRLINGNWHFDAMLIIIVRRRTRRCRSATRNRSEQCNSQRLSTQRKADRKSCSNPLRGPA